MARRLIAAVLSLALLAAPGEPYQCETDLQCELSDGEAI